MRTGAKSLSKREIRMLMIALSVALLTVMVIYVYIPLLDSLSDKRARYRDLVLERAQIDMALSSEAITRDNYSKMAGLYDSIRTDFLIESPGSEIGRMLTDLCLSHGLQPIAQQLSAPVDFVIEDGGADGEAPAGRNTGVSSAGLRNAGNADIDGDYTPKGDLGAQSAFLAVSASMTVSGSYSGLKELLDAAGHTGYIRVTRVSFELGGGGPDFMLEWITINFQVIMLKETE